MASTEEGERKKDSDLAFEAAQKHVDAKVEELWKEMLAAFDVGVYPVSLKPADDDRVHQAFLCRLRKDAGFAFNFTQTKGASRPAAINVYLTRFSTN
jgi:hypothetical protein